MKRIVSIALLSLFLFSIVGYYILFLAMDSQNRNEIQSSLFQNTSLETLRIHKSELKNILLKDNGKEISFNGEMYDVSGESFDGDYITFHCKHDQKETTLLAGLDKQVKNNSDSKSSSEKKQNGKKPVKDLFFHQNKMTVISSAAFEFPSAICHFTSYISSTVSLPPEVSIV
ncbi:MAG: hypothetical protein HY841_06870 [Bacteroidetes bacterium]|nr:hypothetical protein [Bacteroidota bacterium]